MGSTVPPIPMETAMYKIYSSPNSLMVAHLKNLLESHGIPVRINNAYLSGGAGELPLNECWPELWVTDDSQRQAAQAVVQAALNEEHHAASWRCPGCGEIIEGQFTACWRCGAEHP